MHTRSDRVDIDGTNRFVALQRYGDRSSSRVVRGAGEYRWRDTKGQSHDLPVDVDGCDLHRAVVEINTVGQDVSNDCIANAVKVTDLNSEFVGQHIARAHAAGV